MGVSRRDRRPVYQQIADELCQQITEGLYPPGAPLPTLAELCHTYRVSKVTASSALAVLDQQGLIAVRHGLRAVVLPPAPDSGENDLAGVRQQIGAMTARQERIVAQVQSLEDALRRIQQQLHQLQQQDTLPPQPPESQHHSPAPTDAQPYPPQ